MNRDRFLWVVKAVVLLTVITFIPFSCKKEKDNSVGIIKTIKGKAKLLSAGKKIPLKVGDKLKVDDTIITQKKTIVVAYFGKENIKVEIQPNSNFHVEKHHDEKKHFHLKTGNAWFEAIKAKKGEHIRVKSPTSVAGVRGTKFFMFQFPDGISGTCHCHGEVEFKAQKGKKYKAIHSKDTIVFHKGNKTVVLSPEELAFMGDAAHRHSKMSDSPLGPPDDIDPKVMAKVMAIVEAKFKKAK